jgi:hypothetical protein
MRTLDPMEGKNTTARPGPLLCGASIFGLAVWSGVLLFLPRVQGIGWGTYLSAVLMALLFAVLLAGHLSAEIRFRPEEGIAAKTFFRKMQCRWNGIQRVEVRPLLPGVTIYLICTVRGPVVFTSLWRNHRRLLALLQERARFA